MKLVEQRVIDFVAATASKEPTPGGGAIAALTAATGAALAEMVANLTFGKKGYEAVQTEMEELQAKAEAIRKRMLELSQADADVFNIFMNALGLPKNTDEEKAARTAAIFLNVRINLSGIKDESFVAELTSKMYAIEKDLDVKESSIIGLYE
ncbi:MAG: cyclodeaminase/cyclohydrolase family protein [Veillonella sp.]|nr:cyclodeaminase/cyclohydrolase family protein [Veillonella sp.]